MAKRTSWQISRAVIFALLMRELKTRFGVYRLGYFWSLLEPAAHVIILAVVFGFFMRRTMPGIDYTVFLITSIMPWMLFNDTLTRGMGAISANSGLFGYRQVKPMDSFVSRVILEALVKTGAFVVLLILAKWYGLSVELADPLGVIGAMSLLFVFAVGLSLVLCVAVTLYPELQKVVPIVLKPLYFVSAIFFTLDHVPAEFRAYLLWNPVAHAIELTRSGFFSQLPATYASWEVLFAYAAITLTLGMALYRQSATRLVAT